MLSRLRYLAAGLSCVLCGAATTSTWAADDALLHLNKADRISIIGNTLADRMQHHGWLEASIQSRFPRHELVFRNLGFPGDEIKTRPRSANFGSPEQWLTKTETDVVFCFFGYNEALRGEDAVGEFKKDLAGMIDNMRAQKFNGQSAPRIVVFSPIAHEDLGSPHLPDGAENNRKLELYTRAMAGVCREKEVPFVDLFHPTQALYQATDQPLTMNGVHLLDRGNRILASVIDRELFGVGRRGRDHAVLPHRAKVRAEIAANRLIADLGEPADEKQLERLRQAILDRNYHWFSRYRVVDGYNVYGGRSRLAWHGQSNADVMRREMEIFDVMTANRDRRVWAVAKGGDMDVSDAHLPTELTVKTNKQGPLDGGAFPYLGGEEAMDKMTVHQGMQINLFASEEMFPEIVNPVQMAVDTDSRLWVSCWQSYPHWNPVEPREDKIVILPDEDRDGVADKCIVFADQLNSITGFEFWGGGVLVMAPPEIWFLKDTDGDDKADLRLRVLQGISSADTHHSANALLIGPDGWLYWSRGIFNVTNMETPTKTYRSGQSGVHRFNPRTFEVEFHFPIGPNPHGDVFDRWGYQFANDGTGGTGCYVNIGKGVGNKQWFRKRVRPVPANGILSSSHFPPKHEGNFLICNIIGFLGVLQHTVEYNGADITAVEVEPIVSSTDPNFRPSDLEVGGDGALYIADWHNALIGHMQHNMRDPNRDHTHGRVYRVTYPGRPLLEPAKMKDKPVAEVCENFFAKENGTRYRARLELSGRDAADALPDVAEFAARLSPTSADADRDEAQALLECLWVFEEHRQPSLGLLRKVFAAEEPRVRAAAIRTLGHWAGKIDDWEAALAAAARDESALVRAEAAKAAVEFEGLAAAEVVFEVATRPLDPELETVLKYSRGQLNVDQIVQDVLRSGKPLSQAAQLYVLGHASVDELVKLEPTEAVYRAILARPTAKSEHLSYATAGLSKVRNVGELDLLLDLIAEEDAKEETTIISATADMLLQRPADVLASVRQRLQHVAANSKTPAARSLGYAGWITADGSGEGAFEAAMVGADSLNEVLSAVAIVSDEAVREGLYPLVRPLLFEVPVSIEPDQSQLGGGQTLHDRAVAAAASIPGHDAEKFQDLAALIKSNRARNSAVRVLRSIEQRHWDKRQVRPLADSLVAHLSQLPASRRTSPTAMDAIALTKSLAELLPDEQARSVLARLQNLDVRVIAISTVPARMIYDKTRIVVEAGKPVEFRFSNVDNMPHNLSIALPGSMEEIGLLAESTAQGADAIERHYVPKSDNILVSSRLLQPGDSQAISFQAPQQPGVYPIICTYPGHWRRMHAALYVVESLVEFEQDAAGFYAKSEPLIKDELLKLIGREYEWQVEELIESVMPLEVPRSFEVGRSLFKAANCVACHRMGAEKGLQVGPDLTQLDTTKKDTEHILRSVLKPSETIEEKYQSNVFQLNSGSVVTGMILEESDETVKVIENPLVKSKPIAIDKGAIDEREKSTTSIMPEALTNRLNREELLDLIGYVYARGDQKHKIYQGEGSHGAGDHSQHQH